MSNAYLKAHVYPKVADLADFSLAIDKIIRAQKEGKSIDGLLSTNQSNAVQQLFQQIEPAAKNPDSQNNLLAAYIQMNEGLKQCIRIYEDIWPTDNPQKEFAAEIESLRKTHDLFFRNRSEKEFKEALINYREFAQIKSHQAIDKKLLYGAMLVVGMGAAALFVGLCVLFPPLTIGVSLLWTSLFLLGLLASCLPLAVGLANSLANINNHKLPNALLTVANSGMGLFNQPIVPATDSIEESGACKRDNNPRIE